MTTKEEIETAFLEDHRLLIGGLDTIAKSLANGDLAAAIDAAVEVDHAVGPHMRFEEEEYYPRLRSRLGDDYVGHLYEEHDAGREGVVRLLSARQTRLDAAAQEEVKRLIEIALEHAKSCGTLLSHLDSFDESEQRQLLERLNELRARGARWTESRVSSAVR